jgi:ABC-type branched-subunit amino acid transport system ATPase component
MGIRHRKRIREGTVVISAYGLARKFGWLAAIDGVSLDARMGEVHSVIGPNGAGKTTLFNLFTGILMPNEGKIILQGREVTHEATHRRIPFGLARSFQITSIFRSLTTLENVRFALQSLSGARLDLLSRSDSHVDLRMGALRILREVGLAGREDEMAGTLGIREQRLLEIAIALATRPVVLLLDEPLAGLPDSERGRMLSSSRVSQNAMPFFSSNTTSTG